MRTFEDIFCEKHGCSRDEFKRRVFRACLHRRALPFVPLFAVIYPRYFDPERTLVSRVREAEKMNQVWDELRDYFTHPGAQGWLRRKAGVRISGRRLIAFARVYLPASGSPPQPYFADA
jgi:hypothetical protein